MGLALQVGILADLKIADQEGYDRYVEIFELLNAFLAKFGLPMHEEPDDCEVWSGEMSGYSGLQDLRRLAAHLDTGGPLPAPSRREAAKDPVLESYYEVLKSRGQRRAKGGFDHLIIHSDAEGFYLPFDFERVLFPPAELEIPGGMVGSAPRLLAELDRIAKALALPDELHSGSEELWTAADSPAESGQLWQRYGRESYGCVVLREGCRAAIAKRAALVFM